VPARFHLARKALAMVARGGLGLGQGADAVLGEPRHQGAEYPRGRHRIAKGAMAAVDLDTKPGGHRIEGIVGQGRSQRRYQMAHIEAARRDPFQVGPPAFPLEDRQVEADGIADHGRPARPLGKTARRGPEMGLAGDIGILDAMHRRASRRYRLLRIDKLGIVVALDDVAVAEPAGTDLDHPRLGHRQAGSLGVQRNRRQQGQGCRRRQPGPLQCWLLEHDRNPLRIGPGPRTLMPSRREGNCYHGRALQNRSGWPPTVRLRCRKPPAARAPSTCASP